METSEAEKLLDQPTEFSESATGQVAAIPGPPQPPAPGILGNIGPKRAEEQFVQREAAPGIPLDVESGLGPWEKTMLAFRSNQENQIKYLENKYGPGTVRLSSDGELIVRVPDSENAGKVKDLLVRPHQMKATDFIDLMAAVPEIALSIYAMRKGEKIPWLGTMKNEAGQMVVRRGPLGLLREASAAAVGGETAGAAKDIAANLMDIGTPQFGEVLEKRGERVPGMTALGVAGGMVPRFWQFAKNPLAGQRGELQFDLMAAKRYWQQRAGEDMPLSIGQATGAMFPARSEVFIEKMAGGSGPVRTVRKQQEASLRRLQEFMLGTSLPTEEELGTRAINELQSGVKNVTAQTEAAREQLSRSSQNAITSELAGLAGPTRELDYSLTGDAIRKAVISKRDAEKAEADRLFGIVNAAPGGQGKVFEGDTLQDAFKQIKKSLPSPEQTVTTPTPLLNAQGQPITLTSKKVATLREFVPPNVLQRLESVMSLKDPMFSLQDLQQMRREVYDDIAKGEGVPGLGTHYLADIGKAITKSIDDGIAKLPTSDLKTALQAANEHYKNKVVPFNRVGLTEMFRAADEPGSLADNQIITRIFSGGRADQNWKLMRETLGAGSPEFNRLRRSIADHVLDSSRVPGEDTISARDFIRNLYNFSKDPDTRNIYKEVFSPREQELFRQARMLQYAEGDKLNENKLRQLLATPGASGADLRSLVVAERQQDQLYRNQIMKAVGDGTLSEQTLKPSDFLNRMIDNKSVGISEIRQVMGALSSNPALVEDIRRKTYEKLFRDAAREATAGDVNRIMAGDPTHILSGTRIAKSLKDKDFRLKMETVLGPEGFRDLDQYVKLQAGLEMPEQSFRSAGGIASGTQIASAERILEQGGFLAFGTNVARSFVFSWMLSNPAARWWLTRVPKDPSSAVAFLHTLASSPAFLEAVSREFPKTTAGRFVHNLKGTLDRAVMGQQQASAQQQQAGVPQPVRKSSETDWSAFLDQP